MSDVHSDLINICIMTAALLGGENCKEVFGGVMSLFDFARYVYFEFCASFFLNQQNHQSMNQHRIAFTDALPSDYEDPRISHLSKEDKDYLFSLSVHDELSRHLSRTLNDMLENREVPTYDEPEYSPVIAIDKLKKFSNIDEGRLRTTPIGSGYFYQVLTETVVKNEKGQTFEWMSLSRSNRSKFVTYYKTFFKFLRVFMMEEYEKIISDEDVERYIAKAINLCKLEDRNKLSLILNFASTLEQKNIKYFSKNAFTKLPYRFSILPPIFFCCIAPWANDVSCPNQKLINIFRQIGVQIGHIFRTFLCPSPVLWYNQYMDYFLSAKESDRCIEEYRYYTIIILAEFIKTLILSDQIRIEYSDSNFAWFIHNYYNIFDIYEKRSSKDVEETITSTVVRNIRQIVNNIKSI